MSLDPAPSSDSGLRPKLQRWLLQLICRITGGHEWWEVYEDGRPIELECLVCSVRRRRSWADVDQEAEAAAMKEALAAEDGAMEAQTAPGDGSR